MDKIKSLGFYLILTLLINPCSGKGLASTNTIIERKIDSLINLMTIDEKLGQLSIYIGEVIVTGPTMNVNESSEKNDSLIRRGEVTGFFNVYGADYIAKIQKIAVEESRLGIPLIIGADVIHGFKTTFPIPIAEASSWDLKQIETCSRIAAEEMSAAGISWTFAPMVDICRDPRWGRIAESSGEDVYLGSEIAKARVRGFQGSNLNLHNTVMACPKHFVAYGAVQAGREYSVVNISESDLFNIYLPPFKAAVDEGAMSIMTSFNELNGIPTTANEHLCNQILRNDWSFEGLVVSDWASIPEVVNHGVAENNAAAAKMSLEAGTDIDMQSKIYFKHIPELLKQGKIKEEVVDEAVRRVLRCKYLLGLFEDPYLYCNKEREESIILSQENILQAREMAKKSIVLLKNEKNILPLAKSGKSIAVVGPFADNKLDMNGMWSLFSDTNGPVTFLEGIKNKTGKNVKILYAKGCDVKEGYADDFDNAMKIAKSSDVIIACMGESNDMNGEAAARTNIELPGKQQEFLKELKKLGKPIVLVLTNGRPLTLEWEDSNMEAIIEAWSLGTEAGNALADVLFGDYNPSGKLTTTFPRSVGQIPLFYDHMKVGRISNHPKYDSKYIDSPNDPLYPFGYGLSYTTFEYSSLNTGSATISETDTLMISVQVKNSGKYDGEEIVQLYVQDVTASVKRPIKELKGFTKLYLKQGETKEVVFKLTADDLKFYDKGEIKFEPGIFKVFVGKNSQEVLEDEFELVL